MPKTMKLAEQLSRRDLLRALGMGAVFVAGCGSKAVESDSTSGGTSGGSSGTIGTSGGTVAGTAGTTGGAASMTGTTTASSTTGGVVAGSCVQATNVTRGPYFIDNESDPNIQNDVIDSLIPERSDVRSDSEGSAGTQAGLPLSLTVVVNAASGSSCTPIAGAQVHIWHCNAVGVYSDIEASTNGNGIDALGEDFLRGYQVTDANGAVMFTTIYPGWYRGRAVHIHVKIRVFDGSGDITTEATTQLFFDDTLTTQVYAANAAYSTGTRDTMNATDMVYTQESPPILLTLSGSTTTSFTGAVALGIQVGTLFGG